MHVPAPNPSALQTVGSVMVVGGGVIGAQAALDLTELGFKVNLIKKSGAIDGVMARLDKTFPTNDCSLCILPPKLVAAGRAPNIIIPDQVGTYRLYRRARLVHDKCDKALDKLFI